MNPFTAKDNSNQNELDPSLRAGEMLPSEATPEKLAYRMQIPAETPAAVVDYVPAPYADAPEYDPQAAADLARQLAQETMAAYTEIANDGGVAMIRRQVLADLNRES